MKIFLQNIPLSFAQLIIVHLSFLSLTYCSTLSALMAPPKANIQSVRVVGVGLKGIALDVNLQVENPNSTGLTIDRFKYDFAIGDSSLFSGVFDKKVDLKANETSLVTIPVLLNYQDSKAAIENYVFKATRDYKLKGELTSGLLTVPFHDEGKLK